MLRPGEKRTLQRLLFGKVALIVLLIILVFTVRGAWSVYERSEYARESRTHAERELAELEAREHVLSEELQRLQTPRGVEEEIRQKFDVGREGEQLIVLIDAPEPAAPAQNLQPTLWERLAEIFGFR